MDPKFGISMQNMLKIAINSFSSRYFLPPNPQCKIWEIGLFFSILANLVCLGEGYKPIFIKNGPEIRIQHAKNIENSLCEN
jgi:hypothetical protein